MSNELVKTLMEEIIKQSRWEEVSARLLQYYTVEEAQDWLTAPHPQLDGERPITLWLFGQVDEILKVLDRLDSDGYL